MLDFAHDPSGPNNLEKAAAALLDPRSNFRFNMSVWLTSQGIADQWSICGCIAGLCAMLSKGVDLSASYSSQQEAEDVIRMVCENDGIEVRAREWLGIPRETAHILFDPHWAQHARQLRGAVDMSMRELAAMELIAVSSGKEPWDYSPTGPRPQVTMYPLPGESIDQQIHRQSRRGTVRVIHMDLTEIEERCAALCERPVIREAVREEFTHVTWGPDDSPVRLSQMRYTERPMTDAEIERYYFRQRLNEAPEGRTLAMV